MEFEKKETKDSHIEPLLGNDGINDSQVSFDDHPQSEQEMYENEMQVSHVFSDDDSDKDKTEKTEEFKQRNAIFKCKTLEERDKLPDTYLGNNREGDDPLTRQQINQCLMEIEDNHPLRNKAKCEHIVPCCTKCCRPLGCCKKPESKLDCSKNTIQIDDFKMALRSTLLHKINPKLKIPKSEKQMVNDPYLVLGYGINAYFDIIFNLMMCMFICFIAFLPVIFIYSSNPVTQLADQGKYFINQFSLGNMGGSNVFCASVAISKKVVDIKCPMGSFIDTKNVIYGVMDQRIHSSDWCTNAAIAPIIKNEKLYNCTNLIDNKNITTQIKDKCTGKNSCDLNIREWWDTSLTTTATTFVTGKDGACNGNAFFFVQSPCLIPKKMQIHRFVFGLYCGSVAVFVYLFTMLYIDYIKCVQVNNYIDWDVKTITAGDYSIEFDLKPETYERWQEHYHDVNNPISENAQFKIFIQDEMEDRINRIEDQGYDDEGARNYRKKIAKITFAFNNAEVIQMLTERGELIKKEKWDDLDKANEEIADQIKKKPLLDQLQTPCSVFITWETEEALSRALTWSDNKEKPQMSILGQEIEVQPASEPTDIIWENRHFSDRDRRRKRVVVGIVVGLMLIASGIFIFVFTLKSLAAKEKYPPVNCLAVQDYYNPKSNSGKKKWINHAFDSYTANLERANAGNKTDFGGSMQCYCKYLKEQHPTDWLNKSPQHVQTMCKFYFTDIWTSMLIGYSISFLIIAINLILKKVIIILMTWVGEDTLSEQITSITNGVFYALFFNTGILITLVNANMTEHQPKFITKYISGLYYDYSPEWYQNVGEKIVQTMLIQALLPYSALMIGFVKPWLLRKLDKSFSNDIYKTKKTSMAAYKDLYFGADYVIHFKCSAVLNVVWVTMLYGFGLPVLFPIAAFNFFNQYVCERITSAYQVRLPPALDDNLINFVLEKLKWAPLIFLMNGYWMLSNEQIFMNKWEFKDRVSENMKSQHYAKFSVDWALSLEIMLGAAFLIIIAKVLTPHDKLAAWGFGMENQKIEVDEDLPNFFSVIKFTAADEVLDEEKNFQNQFGILINDPDTTISLKKIIMPKKACQGTPWYQMLSNPKYQNDFNYIGANIQEREKLIEDGQADIETEEGEICPEQIALRNEQSDMVMLLLNLAVIPDVVIESIDFNPGWSRRFLKRMKQYRKDWDVDINHPIKWKFQDNELEEQYQQFIIQQYETDIELHKDTIEFQNHMIELNKAKAEKTVYKDDAAPDFEEHSVDSDFYEGGFDNYYYKID